MSWECPSCSSHNPDTSMTCSCGFQGDTFRCQSCNHEVTSSDKKCPHCGINFIDIKNTDTNENITSTKMMLSLVRVIFAFAIVYVAGWDVAWRIDNPYWIALNEQFIFDVSGLAFQFDYHYYGIYITDRYFHSPILSWIMFFIAWVVSPLNELFSE